LSALDAQIAAARAGHGEVLDGHRPGQQIADEHAIDGVGRRIGQGGGLGSGRSLRPGGQRRRGRRGGAHLLRGGRAGAEGGQQASRECSAGEKSNQHRELQTGAGARHAAPARTHNGRHIPSIAAAMGSITGTAMMICAPLANVSVRGMALPSARAAWSGRAA
jgi:hypothetical protein